MVPSKLLILLLSLAIASSCEYSSNMPPVAVSTPEPDTIGIEIDRVFQKFNDGEYKLFNDATADLVRLSDQSAAARARITERLLKIAVNCKNYSEEYREYGRWDLAVDTLGEMKSEEAVNTLGDCISYHDFTGGLGLQRTYPAAYALQRIGKPAIPRLKEIVVSENPVEQKNSGLAIRVMGMIGGMDEIRFLKNRLKTETDKSVRREIEWALERIEEHGKAK